MPGSVFLAGDRLALWTVEPEDYEFIRNHWNRPSNRRMTNRRKPLSDGQIASYIAENDDPRAHFIPCRNGEPVGFIWFPQIDDVSGYGEIGYWICEEHRGSGYATEALQLAVEYGFDDRRLHKLMARVFEQNKASMRVLEKVGFQREGRLRSHYYVNGEYVDAFVFGLLREEFENSR
ncbi:GNAT family N-acetyltransferase [Halegenticoccus soli]|uniref:GNAT family N-acetyltransferase n=1 Tax=Halegenticoccus soli TaxID=1985678 RepID=UPI000C6CA1B3|nr:GNAT family protein [Halegenticoccus soli]